MDGVALQGLGICQVQCPQLALHVTLFCQAVHPAVGPVVSLAGGYIVGQSVVAQPCCVCNVRLLS